MKRTKLFTTFCTAVVGMVVFTSTVFALPLGDAIENLGSANEAAMYAQAQNEADTGRTRYKSTQEETKTFDGVFIPSSNSTKLAVLSDDGVTITVNGQATNVSNVGMDKLGLI